MPARRFASLMGLCLALGCLLIGHGLLVPALTHQSPGPQALIDPNLANAIAAPLALLASTVAAIASAVLLLLAPRAFAASSISTLCLAAFAGCVIDRLVLLPRVHEALGHVDLVTAAPANAVARLELWQLSHQLCVATACALLAAVAWVLAHRIGEADAAPAVTIT